MEPLRARFPSHGTSHHETLLICQKRLSCPSLHVKPCSECMFKIITQHKYINLPLLVVFYNQCYRGFFCSCTNLRYIEITLPRWSFRKAKARWRKSEDLDCAVDLQQLIVLF